MSFVARGLVVVAAVVGTTLGCNSVFRFDDVASPSSADGGEGGTDEAAAPCADDTTCAGLRCQVTTGTCVACLADTDCSGIRRHCDVATGTCVECNTTTDCGSITRACEGVTKRCLDLCADGDECTVPFACGSILTSASMVRDHVCIECMQDPNCVDPTKPHCDRATGRCVECKGNAQCPSSDKPVCDRRTGKCAGCVTSAECDAGEVCDPTSLTCHGLL